MRQLICSRQLLRPVQVAVVVLLVLGLELELELAPISLAGVVLVLEPQLVDWETSTSCGTTPNSNNCDKSYNRTPRCSNLSCNKLVLETPS
jgi:hypothetical protein